MAAVLLGALTTPLTAADKKTPGEVERPRAVEQPATLLEAEDNLSPDAGVRYVAGKRRDPFLNPLLLRKKSESLNEEVERGQAPPGIAGMYLAQVKFLGTSLRESVYTAVFRGTDSRFYFLKEGDRFFDGYLKKIVGDSVVLVRETNLRSGKVRNEDVVRHLRTP